MTLKRWWVTAVVFMLMGMTLVVATRANAAPAIFIPLGTDTLPLGTVIDDLGAEGDVLIDDGAFLLVRGDAILHDERDVVVNAADRLYQWDGPDSSDSLDQSGLGGWDATHNGMVNRFEITVAGARGTPLTLTVYDERGGSATVTGNATTGKVAFPFDGLRGVDMSRVGAIELRVPGALTLRQIRTASDFRAIREITLIEDGDRNGIPSNGDVLAYDITFYNEGTATAGSALWQTTVQGRHGVVDVVRAEGAIGGRTAAGTGSLIQADLSGLASGGSATLHYEVRLQGGAVPVTVALEEGATLPEGTVGTLNAPFTNGDGEDGFVATINGTDRLIWFDNGVIWQNSDAAPTNTLTGGESTMGIGNNGQFIYSPSDDGDDAVWTHLGPLLVDGDPAPTYPPPALNVFNSRPTMLPDGTAIWVAGANPAGGTTTTERQLYSDADGAPGGIVALLRTGDVYDGTPIDSPAGIGLDYQQSDNASNLVVQLLLDTGSTTNDDIVGVNGSIIARELSPTGEGDNWDNMDSVSINNSGTTIFSGDTDGATTSDEFIAYATLGSTPTLPIREGDTLDGITLIGASVNAASINNLNQAAFIWTYTGGETLFVACDASNLAGAQAILSVGDEILRNGGGGGFIDDFNASSITGPGLWLAEDGLVYVEVDIAAPVPFMGGTTEAVISLETGCSSGGTPTPTATGPAPTNTPTNTPVPPTATPTSAPPTVTPTSTRIPDINVTPNAFVETHSSPPQVTTDTMFIQNTEMSVLNMLNWSIVEANERPWNQPNPVQPRDPSAPVERQQGTSNGPTAAPDAGPIVGDGSFETGSPNASWEEFETTFGTPLCDEASCGLGGGTGPRTGAWWAWFGGIASATTGAVTQTVTIPSGSADLSFWLEIPAVGQTGFVSVRVDGTEVFRAEEDTTGYATYAEVVVDISAYADGGSHELSFFSQTNSGSAPTNFFVDDVAIEVSGGGSCDAPSDIPWLTVSPMNGTTTGGTSSPVTLTYNSASLAVGSYSGTLCITSNDPDEPLVTVPVTLIVEEPPTAIDLNSFSAPVSPIHIADLAAAGLLVLAGMVLVLRRK